MKQAKKLQVVPRHGNQRRDDGHDPCIEQMLRGAQDLFPPEHLGHDEKLRLLAVFYEQVFKIEGIVSRALEIGFLPEAVRWVDEGHRKAGAKNFGVDILLLEHLHLPVLDAICAQEEIAFEAA